MAQRRTDVWNQLLALHAYRDGHLFPCGTAFLVGKRLAMTATHVLDQPFDRHDYDPNVSGESSFGVVAQQIIDRRQEPLLWRVKEMGRYPSLAEGDDRPFDVGLLALEPLGDVQPEIENHRRWFFELNVATPRVGTRVKAYGFAESACEPSPEEPLVFNSRHSFRRVPGEIVAIHFPKRDNAAMPFPCFQIAADFEPGMSGGPVFNDRDQVCGVVSRGGGFGVSWASILWPALAIRIEGKIALQLVREAAIRTRNYQCVNVYDIPGEPFPGVSFDPNREIP
jgi:Trypsin-like peptidase domain